MRFIMETVYRSWCAVVALSLFVFCGLVVAAAVLIKGEDGGMEALEFSRRVIW